MPILTIVQPKKWQNRTKEKKIIWMPRKWWWWNILSTLIRPKGGKEFIVLCMRSLNKVKLLFGIDKVSIYLAWFSQQVQWSQWIIWMLWAKWVTMVPPFSPQRCCASTGKPLFCLVYRSSWYCQPLLWCIQCNQLMQPFMSCIRLHTLSPLELVEIFLRGKQ